MLKAELKNNERIKIAIISIVVGSVILVLKFLAYALTNSAALKSDALESVVNVIAAVFALGAVVFAERPADESHPYGHGKIEFFSAAFEGGLISLAAILILYEAALSWYAGPQIKKLDVGILLNLAAGATNGLLGYFLISSGRKKNSKAIEADGHHVLSDFYTTIGLIVGLVIVKLTGYFWLDPILAMGIGLLLAYTGFKLVRESSEALLDKEDPELITRLVKKMNEIKPKDVISIHALRTLRSGRHTHIDIHIAVPEFYSLDQAHDIVDKFGDDVVKDLGIDGEFHAHMDPCRKFYCENCEVSSCPLRKLPFKQTMALSLESCVSPDPV